MALTGEIIKANESLAGLTDAQITAISTLSTNDENTVISARIGKLHGDYDKDVLATSGVAKNEGEKSYDYVKRVLGDYKTKAGSSVELQTKITTYEGEITDLKKQIKDGNGDAATKQMLKDAEDALKAVNTSYETDKKTWETEKGEYSSKLSNYKINSEFGKALAGVKFKAEYPANVQKVLVDSAKSKILSTCKADWVEANGEKTMVFRGADGEILRNKNNALQPYSAAELLATELKDVIDLGKKAAGGGTRPDGGKADPIELVDIASAKTRIEADELIAKHLMQQGETRGSESFIKKMIEIRESSGVSKLPMR